MREIYPNLYIGNQDDYEVEVKGTSDWFVIHACKEPYHRLALGYSGRAASKSHPEYLIARRDGRMILNLVDVDDVKYISKEIIDDALNEISLRLKTSKVLVHCNQGQSRSATIGLLYLKQIGKFSNKSFNEAETEYRTIYPSYSPANGMRTYAMSNWNQF